MLGPNPFGKTALKSAQGSLSWGALTRLIDAEIKRSVDRPKGVAILTAQHDFRFVIQLLACLKSGQPVAIFSPAWSHTEVEKRRELLGQCYQLGSQGNVIWDAEKSSKGRQKIHHPETALILFTSGSTGQPKGVQLSLQNIEANTEAVLQSLDFEAAEKQVLFLPLHYSFGLLGQLLPALKVGMCTQILSNFIELKELFDHALPVGMLSGVPTHWTALLRITEGNEVACRKVSHVISAGAALQIDLRRKLAVRFPQATLYNNYGLTECSPRALWFSSRHPQFFNGATGFPVKALSVELNSSNELCLKGPQVMLGYLGEPEATDEKIREGWLYSGDEAEVDKSGLITVKGRKDELFKLGAERTSPLEIENAIKAIPQIDDAAVLLEDDPLFGIKLLAFIVVSQGMSVISKRQLLPALSKQLTSQKMPREFFITPDLPRTENGKLQRHCLRALKESAIPIEF